MDCREFSAFLSVGFRRGWACGGPSIGPERPDVFGHHLAVAGERKRWQRIEREHPDLEHLWARSRPAAGSKPGLVGDPDHAGSVPLGDVIDADEPRHLDAGANFFEA